VPGTVLFHKARSPPGGVLESELGRPSQARLPLPHPGDRDHGEDSILLQLKPAELDFSDLIKGRSCG
jgi:hypothetical protein